MKEGSSSRAYGLKSHFMSVIDSIPDEGEIKLDSNDEPIEGRNFAE